MKKILITGKGSYIGSVLEGYLSKWEDKYSVETLDMLGDGWKSFDFSGYDAVVHVAGIAHQKETKENAELYYKVNRDLAIEVAKKAKECGVGQFVFLSSMSVYGMDRGVITPETVPSPKSNYGISKLQAEAGLKELEAPNFKISVLRPPMVYGKNCRGNFQLMLKLVKKSPVFPAVKNQRSMISVLNLSAFIRLVIDKEQGGVFFPQNREYVNTTEMAHVMAETVGKKVFFSSLAGLLIKMVSPFVSAARKAFSTLIYKDCEVFGFEYEEESFSESVKNSI